MRMTTARRNAVQLTITNVQALLADGIDIESLTRAKERLIELAAQKELFPRTDFPLPEAGQTARLFRIHQQPNGEFALYVNSGTTGQSSRPHDHGDSWAISVAIEGSERHYVYAHQADGVEERLESKGQLDVKPGQGLCMLPGDIHQISALSSEPLLHLHLYGVCFENQIGKRIFNVETGKQASDPLDWYEIEDSR